MFEFDQYLKRFGYTFKNQINELAGYTVLQNKKFILAADIGSSPEKIYTKDSLKKSTKIFKRKIFQLF